MIIKVWHLIGKETRALIVTEALAGIDPQDRCVLAQGLAKVLNARFQVVARWTVRKLEPEVLRVFGLLDRQILMMLMARRYAGREDLRDAFNESVGLPRGSHGSGENEPARAFDTESFTEFRRAFGEGEVLMALAFVVGAGRQDCRVAAESTLSTLLRKPKQAEGTGRVSTALADQSVEKEGRMIPSLEPKPPIAEPTSLLIAIPDVVDHPISEVSVRDDSHTLPLESASLVDVAVLISEPTEASTLVPASSAEVQASNSEVDQGPVVTNKDSLSSDWSLVEQRPDEMDRIMIRAIVASMNKELGAFESDEIGRLVDGFIHLNSTRHRSYFYLGFLEALTKSPLVCLEGGMNQSRRGWYLAGYFLGFARTHGNHEFLTAIKSIGPSDLEALRSPTARGAVQQLGVAVIDAAISVRDAAIVVDWLAYIGSTDASSTRRAAEFALSLRVESTPEACRALAGVAEHFLDRRMLEGVRIVDDQEAQVRLALVGSLRQIGAHQSALDALLEPGGGWSERMLPQAAFAQLLLRGQFVDARTLIPDSEEALGRMVEVLEREIQTDDVIATEPASVMFQIAGLLARLRTDGSVPRAQATSLLFVADEIRRVLRHTGDSVWHAGARKSDLEQAIAVLAALLILVVGIEDGAAEAARTLEDWIAAKGLVPVRLLKAALDNAAALDCPNIATLYAEAIGLFGQEVVDLEALQRTASHRQGRESLFRLLGEPSFSIPLELRWSLCIEIGRVAIAYGGDQELALKCFEQIQDIASEEPSRFAARLVEEVKSDRWISIADEDERDTIAISMGLLGGDYGTVADSLMRQLNRAIASDQLRLATDLLDFMRKRGLGEYVDAKQQTWIASRLKERVAGPVARTHPNENRSVRILFVGGNDMQANWDSEIDAWLRDNLRGVKVTWIHSGWSSNWSRYTDQVEREIDGVAAIVLMKFVRTILGEKVRKLANEHGKPWIPCTGHGAASVRRAVTEAARIARSI